MQVHAGQRLVQLAVLLADALAVDDEQRRAELLHQPADLHGLERIEITAAAGTCEHGSARLLGKRDGVTRPQRTFCYSRAK